MPARSTPPGLSTSVDFSGATGTPALATAYDGAISGFPKTGGITLDLDEIAYVPGSNTIIYQGTKKGGTLTVSDGTHIAHIKLTGGYTNTFLIVGEDPEGGVKVVDNAAMAPPAPSPHLFTAAMAGTAGGASAASSAIALHPPSAPHLLTAPRAQGG